MSWDMLDNVLDFIVDRFCPENMRCGLFLGLTGEPLLDLQELCAIREHILCRLSLTDGRVYLERSLVTNCTTGVERIVSDP